MDEMASKSTDAAAVNDPKGKGSSKIKCSFVGCGRTQRKHPNLHFYRFPVNRPTILEQWLVNCGNENIIFLSNNTLYARKVCEKHFTSDSFVNENRKHLKKDAVPTVLELGDDEIADQSASLPSNSDTDHHGVNISNVTEGQNNDADEISDQSISLSSNGNTEHHRLNISNVTEGQKNYVDGVSDQFISLPSTSGTEHHRLRIYNVTEAQKKGNERQQLTPTKDSQLSCQTTTSPKTPTTPAYKKYKSVKNRTPTPRKKVLTPMKRRLLSKLKISEKKKKKFQMRANRIAKKNKKLSKHELVSAIQDYLPPAVSKFFSMQLNHVNSKRKPWTEEERRIALSWSYISPRFYEHMRKDGFILPNKSTIARWLQDLDLRPGICQDLVNTIKAKVECMTQWEKKCVILFDEMQIKTSLEYDSKRDVVEGLRDLGEIGRSRVPGSKVLLFMARGLVHSWKMPFAYFVVNDAITSELITHIIRLCVTAIQEIGLEVRSVVCDQSSTNRGAAKLMGISLKTPFFFCKGEKVYWLYDFPHVIKCIRNNLMKKNKEGQNVGSIETAKGVADWRHVENLYNIDKLSTTARATKLTEKHINPSSFEKMSVKLATQVFSHSVSAAMKTAVDAGQLPPEAKETATFTEEVNNIFDAMNSRTRIHPNANKCAISNSTDPHLKRSLTTIKDGIQWVRTWKMVHGNKRPPSFVGMEHTMRTTLLLWKDVQEEGVAYLLTGRLNQDPLENEFSIARQRCGYNRNPTARLFRQNLRHRIKCALLQPPTGANCEPDEDNLIDGPRVSSVLPRPTTSNPTPTVARQEIEDREILYEDSEDSESDDFEFSTSTTEDTQSLENCAVRYFAGYAVRACLKKHDCQTCCDELVKPTSSSLEPDDNLIRYRQYTTASGEPYDALMSPSDATVNVSQTILHTFHKMFVRNIHRVGIRSSILMQCKRKIHREYCEWMKFGTDCYTHRMFFMNKILTAKLHWKLKELSKEMRQPGGKHGGYFKKVKILEGK